jgi:cell wall-associated NlpC family hydrolase
MLFVFTLLMSKTESILLLWLVFLNTCRGPSATFTLIPGIDTVPSVRSSPVDTGKKMPVYHSENGINTANTTPGEIVAFAKTMIGTPYLYASTDPAKGFDCSGFITYVFNHFGITVPRSSVDFTNVGKEVKLEAARQGDLILFTGTDNTIRVVGHMGIIVNNENDSTEFIHSTSGKQKGVVITPFEDYYRSRFIKIVRLFPDR